MRQQTTRPVGRRGAVAVMAMMFLVLFTTLTLAMYGMSTANVQSASNLSDVVRAQGAAESGLRWIAMRFWRMPRPETLVGTVNATAMNTLWPQIRGAIVTDMNSGPNRMVDPNERTWAQDPAGGFVQSPPISTEDGGATFRLDIRQSADDPTVLVVTSTGRYRQSERAVSMKFKVEKKIKFAVVGKVPIQLGRNTIVEGPVGMSTPNKFPPLLMLSDFTHFDAQLADAVEDWNEHLQGSTVVDGREIPHHSGYDNRISMNNPQERQFALDNGYADVNGDEYIDEYDLFVRRFDNDGDARITQSEFTNPSTGRLYEPELFSAIDSIGAPMFAGDPERMGYKDGIIDNSDGYAKLRGSATIASTADAWAANLAPQGKTINDMIQGTIAPTDPVSLPVRFGANSGDMMDLDPENFEQCSNNFKARAGTAGGASINTATEKANLTLSAAMANGGRVDERTPFGSTTYQATYRRPVFRDMTFRNVKIPKGLNALFDNCRFEGVTFVENERNIVTSGGSVTQSSSEGMNWSKRRIAGDSFTNAKILLGAGTTSAIAGQSITHGSQKGNNLRFNNCRFEGPLAGDYATAYTHFANSWEFTGETFFDNRVDQTATIVAPQANIEMGSFTDPNAAPSTLTGVVVAGNIDIRGRSNIDGSIIVTGDGAGNTTLAYFGASDSSTSTNPNPEGGYGKLNIRYNPYRALPDGILMPVDIAVLQGTYQEVRR